MVALIAALLERPHQMAEVKVCLETAGHEVVVVDSFTKAKALLETRSFDLIISDVHLENGGTIYDFLKWAKSHEKYRAVPFVLFSLEPTPLAKYLADGVRTTSRYLGAEKYICMDKLDAGRLVDEICDLLPHAVKAADLTNEGK
jgi:CheY-like chemotaxis protein